MTAAVEFSHRETDRTFDMHDQISLAPPSLLRPGGMRASTVWLALIVAVGVACRLHHYLLNRSLWHDEILLVATFADRGFPALIFQPLDNNQAAPLAFLVLVKAITSLFGTHEWSLRLLSLVCGLAALGLALPIARQLFPAFAARATFVALVAASPALIYYSAEFKQYEGDVLCTMLILWLTLRFRPDQAARDALWLGLVGAACVWLSHPSVFVLAGSGLTLWLEMARRREKSAWLAVTAAGLAWLASFSINYVLTLRSVPGNHYLAVFWANSFAPFPPKNLDHLRWFGEAALGLVYLAMSQMGTAFREVLPGWFSVSNILLLALTAAGVWPLARLGGRAAATGTLSLMAALGASALHQYPFRARLILFLVPFVFLALAALVQKIHDLTHRWAAWWPAAALAVATLLVPVRLSAHVTWHPHNFQDLRTALEYVAAHREPGDHAMFSSWTHHFYHFYSPRVGLEDMPTFEYTPTANEQHNILSTVRRICKEPDAGRTWVVATNQIVANNRAFLDALNGLSPPLFTYPLEGAAVFLHDFRPTAFCQRYRDAVGTAPASPAH